MLIPGMIPENEPILRVGIVLPEDRMTRVNFFIQGNARIIGEGQFLDVSSASIGMEVEGTELSFMFRGVKIKSKSFTVSLEDEFDFFEVWPVIAGRGFHWQKEIAVKLNSKLEFDVSDGCILLVNELPMEQYLACVATSEMSADCPDAMIEAQTIVARSWMLANVEQKHRILGFDVCNDDCCQRFQGITNLTDHAVRAAEKTRGRVLMYGNKICDARYSKSCGGVMEIFENLWDGEGLPYMQNLVDAKDMVTPDLTIEENFVNWIHVHPAVFCSEHFIAEESLKQYLGNVDETGHYFRWMIEIGQEELTWNFNQKLNLNAAKIVSLTPLSRGGSGRMLELRIEYQDKDGAVHNMIIYKDYKVREVLHPSFLYSSACLIEPVNVSNGIPMSFRYTGGGWGHGAGLCQIGALGMALKGFSVEEILEHYYPGSVLNTIY